MPVTPQGNGKVAIVTGAAQGIGRAIAFRLASEGFDLGLADLASSRDLLEGVSNGICISQQGQGQGQGKTRVVLVAVDVSQEREVYDMVAKVVSELGRLDVMVANAGIAPVCPFLDMTADMLDRIFSINVRGVFLCYQAAAKQMIKQGEGGRLIAACSTSGLRTGRDVSGYCASKFAVRALNQGAALEFGPYGITANVYCPTVVETDMWKHIDQVMTAKKGKEAGSYTQEASLVQREPREKAYRAAINPLGRNATPEDIAAMVAFLASKDASFVSGQAMQVTGGDWLS